MHLKATLTYREFNFNYCNIVQVIQFEKFSNDSLNFILNIPITNHFLRREAKV